MMPRWLVTLARDFAIIITVWALSAPAILWGVHRLAERLAS